MKDIPFHPITNWRPFVTDREESVETNLDAAGTNARATSDSDTVL
jgi:hypothetical protein